MTTRTTPSQRLRQRALLTQNSRYSEISMGSRKNNPIEKARPISRATKMTPCLNFSLPSFFSSQMSSLPGSASASSSSSGKKSAEYIRALTPLYMEEKKVTTPRIRGRRTMGLESLLTFRSSTFSTMPSGARTTMACL